MITPEEAAASVFAASRTAIQAQIDSDNRDIQEWRDDVRHREEEIQQNLELLRRAVWESQFNGQRSTRSIRIKSPSARNKRMWTAAVRFLRDQGWHAQRSFLFGTIKVSW